jgi:hypothetical protein
MTALAGRRQMSADKGKARLLMLLHHICHAPVKSAMAPLAVVTQFAFMNIRMTGKACRTLRREFQSFVAGCACQ